MTSYRTWTVMGLSALAIVAVALGAVACNDGGDKLTLEEYFQEVDQIDNDSTERIDAAFNDITDQSDIQQFKDAFKQFAPILDDAADHFDALDPPDDVREAHDAMAEALNAFADKANDIAADVDEIEASTPEELFTAIDEEGFSEAADAFDARCLDLQQIANDHSVVVDLDCGDEDEAAAEVEQTMRDAMAAWNGQDAGTFLTFFTDKAISEIFGEGEPVTREEVAGFLPEIIGDPQLVLHELTTEADGDTGAATVLWESEPFLEHIRFAMVNEEGAWRIDSQDYIDVEDLPDGTTMVHVDVNEFAFGVADDDLISANASGLIGFEITNVGEQTHHFGLLRLPAEGDIQELLMSEEDAPGLDVAGFTDPIEPGETNRAWVFIEPLEPGRYAMVCFLPDTTEGAEGTPHAFKGMVHEFTIPEAGGANR
jgi:hypothetical protein